MARRYEDDDDDEEEAESWLASYSDLVTDLMAVFVLLFSFALMSQSVKSSQVSAEREKAKNVATQQAMEMGASAEEFVDAIEEKIKLAGLEGQVSVKKESPGAQGGSPGKSTTEENDASDQTAKSADSDQADKKAASEQMEKRNENIEKFIKELKGQFKNAGLEGQVSVKRNGENMVVIRLMDSVLFDRGKAVIKDEVKPTLDSIAGILSKYGSLIRYVHIEGHTDNLPINTPQFPSNWELSTGRAGSVVRYLIDKSELKDEIFSSSGYGEFRPIGDNATEEGRSLNRRVEFSIEIQEAGNAE